MNEEKKEDEEGLERINRGEGLELNEKMNERQQDDDVADDSPSPLLSSSSSSLSPTSTSLLSDKKDYDDLDEDADANGNPDVDTRNESLEPFSSTSFATSTAPASSHDGKHDVQPVNRAENDDIDDDNDEDRAALSEYELLRLERIRRNQQKLAQLGLVKVETKKNKQKKRNSSMGTSASAKKQNQQQQEQQQIQDDLAQPPSRSSLSRSSKRSVNYAELGPRWSVLPSTKTSQDDKEEADQKHLSSENADCVIANDASDRPPSQQAMTASIQIHPQQQAKLTPTNTSSKPKKPKKPRMAKFIYREFQRIQGLQQQTLKQAQRHVRLANSELRHVQKAMDKYQRYIERKLFMQQEREQRRIYRGKTLREMLSELDSRLPEVIDAARQYDARQQALVYAATLESQQKDREKKMEVIDALDRFPKEMKRTVLGLNKLLNDRAPKDPPPPRRSKRKAPGTSQDDGNLSKSDTQQASNEASDISDCQGLNKRAKVEPFHTSSTMTLASILSTSPAQPQSELQQPQAMPCSKDSDEAASTTVPTTRISKKRIVSKNVGGWVSPQFSQEIDRRWLEIDEPESSFRLETYVPQAGDIVLYYPEGHRLFLKSHPDVLGAKTRANIRQPLWERARKEQIKKQQVPHSQDQPEGTAHTNETIATDPPTSNTSQHWWTDEWLTSVVRSTGFYPILCRVEKTQPEFPPDPRADDKIVTKDQSSGNIQVIWTTKSTDSTKKKDRRPPLCLAVTLRALTPVTPPPPQHQPQSNDGVSSTQDGSQSSVLAPKFSVVIFPSTVARPYLVPFSWAYRKFHLLVPGSRVVVQYPEGMNSTISAGKVINFDLPIPSLSSARLEEQHVNVISSWISHFQIPLDATSQAIFETLSQNMEFRNSITPIPFADALTVIETWIHLVRSAEHGSSVGAEQHARANLSDFCFLNLVRLSFPILNGVSVVRDAYDRKRHNFSSWELELQPTASPKLQIQPTSGTCPIQPHPSSLDGALRLKIELTLEEFLKNNPEAEIFCPLVLDSDAPSYSCAVPLGMAFNRMLRRLEANAAQTRQCYYRHADAILCDMGMIEDNCLLYNSPDSEVVEKAALVVKEVKRQVTQVVSSHTRENDLMLKEEQMRQRFVQFQCDAVMDNQCLDNVSLKARIPTKNMDSTEMFTPFKDPLCRDWLQDFEPDDSVPSSSISTRTSTSKRGVGSWVPQAGDQICYCESAHADFLKAHYRSLTNEQCQLPRLQSTRSRDTSIPLVGDQKVDPKLPINGSIENINTSWIIGTIVKVRMMFPRRKPKQECSMDSTFQVNSPILSLEVRFEYDICDFFTIYWRPCELNERLSENKCESSRRCTHCGLSIHSSFLHPAWLATDRSNVLPWRDIGCSLAPPPRLKDDDVDSINRCFNLLKRRCISGCSPDFVDREKCIADLKRNIYPATQVKASSLPSFEDIFHLDKKAEDSRIGTRGVRVHGIERHESILAESNFIPRWAASTSNEDSDAFTPKRCEALFPCPNLCLELIQLRLRHGFYRHKAAILNDIEEAYIQAILFLLAGPATRRKNPLSIKKLVKAIFSKSNISRLSQPLSEISLSDQSLGQKSALESSSIPSLKEASQNSVKNEGLFDEEIALLRQLGKIRCLFATAILCVSETRLVEITFGTRPQPKGKAKETCSAPSVNPNQEAARQKLNLVLGAVGTDRCLNRFVYRPGQFAPQPRVKIICGDETIGPKDGSLESSGESPPISSIIFSIGDIRDNGSLTRLFFGRPGLMNPCARCQVYQRSILDCRVMHKHSNIDFDWTAYSQDGEIVGILQQLTKREYAPEKIDDGTIPKCEKKDLTTTNDQETGQLCSIKPSEVAVAQNPSQFASMPTTVQAASLNKNEPDSYKTVDCADEENDNQSSSPAAAQAKVSESSSHVVIHSTQSAEFVEPDGETGVLGVRATHTESVVSPELGDADKELESLVDPCEDFEKAMVATRLSSQLLIHAEAAARTPPLLHPDFIRSYFPLDPADGHYMFCVVCGLSGDLICCDGCPNVLHQQCAKLNAIPEGDWYCKTCNLSKERPSQSTSDGRNENSRESTLPTEVDKAKASEFVNGLSKDSVESWRSNFIGITPFDFSKEAELAKILNELRSSRLKSLQPPCNSDLGEAITSHQDENSKEGIAPSGETSGAASSANEVEKIHLTTDSTHGENSKAGEPEGMINIGFVVSKNFGPHGSFMGKVISLPTEAHPFYGILYEDGDKEDMSESELQDHVPLATLKAKKGGKAKRSSCIDQSSSSTPKRVDPGAQKVMPSHRMNGKTSTESMRRSLLKSEDKLVHRKRHGKRQLSSSSSLQREPRCVVTSSNALVSRVQDLEERPIPSTT